jgi:hypothetical protein
VCIFLYHNYIECASAEDYRKKRTVLLVCTFVLLK